ncbi:alpha/beta fold hydrolase [Rubrobacter calidifluminis]|uniref:alpha/beta fold hydrolase n=1 Tax=Rubrobacter calidifluminis TaxID=1392640 RepID=UPI002361A46D|nr:alpha/beta hydrolase [Rubrobacter calidifluminis]
MGVIVAAVVLIFCLLGFSALVLGRTAFEVENPRGEDYVELEGSIIRYHVRGEGPPVLLVHGWLSSSRVWEDLVEVLEDGFTIYTLDLKGFGASDKPLDGRYGIRYGGRLLYAFCAHFGLGRVSVVGHDLGGAMAVKLAADHPEMVERLVLVSTPADGRQIDLPTPLWLATLPVVGPLFYFLGQHAGWVRRMWLRPFVSDRKSLRQELVEDAGRSTPTAVRRTLSMARRELSRGRIPRQARSIRGEVLVVTGEEDYIVDPEAVDDWSKSMPQASISVLEGCGHLPMVEYPEEFCSLVRAFLSGERTDGGAQRTEWAGRQDTGGPPRPDLDETMDLGGGQEHRGGLPDEIFEWPPEFERGERGGLDEPPDDQERGFRR